MVRPQDLPDVEPASPFRHLDERKASIYENLRDLQFEYRVGKLSDADYQGSKQSLQKELAAVMAEVDKLKAELNGHVAAPRKPGPVAQAISPANMNNLTCAACGASFEKELK